MPLCPSSLFFLMPHRPPSSTLFPYTTLFRSNFEHADVPRLLAHFEDHERMCQALLAARLPLPAYEQVLKASRSEEHTSELQSPMYLVCRLLLEKKKKQKTLIPLRPIRATCST